MTTITDSNQIAGIVKFIANHNNNWRVPLDTFPSGRYTIDLYDNGQAPGWFYGLGQTWLGGRNGDQGARDNRLRDLSPEEQHQFVSLLGIQYPNNSLAGARIASFSS